ncbi:thioesterase II family protein [Streptomyces sp. NPDC058794]|uniref:thioesterase II family protein n=1 Tax=unclassified Streptomyces TaxID=2593676 RepID=UPI003673903F
MAGVTTASTAWIRRFHPSPERRCRLICFAHAGGSASAYHPLSAALAPEVEVLAVQYPGRHDRRGEALVDDLHALADLAHQAVLSWTGEPFALFGHSMGAVVAFEVARRMEASASAAPVRLFVSGRRAPSCHRPESAHLLSDDDLIGDVASLGGTESAVLEDQEIRRLVLPIIRNDYRAVETYRSVPDARLGRTPVTAFVGDGDPRATVEESAAWERHTSAGFDASVFPGGGHFYLSDFRAELTRRITDRLPVQV